MATTFTEEHKKALDWLNDNTNEDLAFWGIQIELWQIGEDTASVRFNIVSQPSLDVKAIKKKSEVETESSKTQLQFWTRFCEKLQETKHISKLQTPKGRYWYDVSIGKSYIHLSNICNTWNNIVGVRLYIENKMANNYFPALLARKDEINKALGFEPTWDANPTAKDKTIAVQTSIDFDDSQKYEQTLDWMVQMTLKFYDVFSKEVKSL